MNEEKNEYITLCRSLVGNPGFLTFKGEGMLGADAPVSPSRVVTREPVKVEWMPGRDGVYAVGCVGQTK